MANFAPTGGVRPTLSVVKLHTDARHVRLPSSVSGERADSTPENPVNVFSTSSLTIRAMDLAGQLDSIGEATKVFDAAVSGIAALTRLVDSARGLARQALQSGAEATGNQARAEMANKFDALRDQIGQRAAASGHKDTNLLDGGVLRVQFGEKNAASFTVSGVKFDASGLDIAPSVAGWQSDEAIIDALSDLTTGLTILKVQTSIFGASLSVIQTQEDFTRSLVESSHLGSDIPTLAEQDEEAARLVTLNTRQQFATAALTLTTRSEQSVLRLF